MSLQNTVRIAGKFGGMPFNHQIKIRQIFFRMHVRMAIPYHTAKLKSANSVKNIVYLAILAYTGNRHEQGG